MTYDGNINYGNIFLFRFQLSENRRIITENEISTSIILEEIGDEMLASRIRMKAMQSEMLASRNRMEVMETEMLATINRLTAMKVKFLSGPCTRFKPGKVIKKLAYVFLSN